MNPLEFPAPALAEACSLEAPTLPFKMLHLDRAPELDFQDKRAFNVWLELVGLIEMGSPCLFFLAPQDERCAFAIPQHAPKTHINQLMMLVVDQDSAHEALAAFEERVRERARRLLAVTEPAAAPAPVASPGVSSSSTEPPEWLLEPPLEAYDPYNEVPDYGDLE